jgi:hypothetical protein
MVSDYLPPGPPDPPRLCKYCDTRRATGVTPIHEPGCPRHPSNRTPPQQDSEPGEVDPWGPNDSDREAVGEFFRKRLREAPGEVPIPESFWSFVVDRLRARVQPRRVSREEFEAVVREIREGMAEYADPTEVAIDALDALGIEITPTKE